LNYKTKIWVDRICGIPLVYGLNILARILGFFLRIDHSLNRPVKTIAVCKFVGMGSIIQSTPLLKTLRKNYPHARIIFITNASNLNLFRFIDEVDEVFHVSDKNAASLLGSNIKLLLKLWRDRPDVYIDLEIYSNYSSVIATMSLARNRMGFFKDDKTYRKGMYTHMMFFNIKSPVSQTYLQFARLMGCRVISTELSINRNKIDTSLFGSINKKLNTILSDNYILVNPNASDLRLERRWPAENFVSLIRSISVEQPGLQIIIIGDKNEAVYVSTIVSQLKECSSLIDSSGKLSVSELIALISRASLLITNDTGPMHLAFALKIRTVSLFGPCSPRQYGGTENTISLYKNTYCSPCVHEFIIPPCKGDNQCMKKISISEVQAAVKNAMSGKFEPAVPVSQDYLHSDESPLGVVLR
jgi:ADP-heptose:LPS heptosyltransferase